MVDYLAIFFSFIIIIIIIIWKWKIIHHHHYHFSSADTIIQSIVSYNGYTPILGVQSNVCVCVVCSIYHPSIIYYSIIDHHWKKGNISINDWWIVVFSFVNEKKHVVVCVCVWKISSIRNENEKLLFFPFSILNLYTCVIHISRICNFFSLSQTLSYLLLSNQILDSFLFSALFFFHWKKNICLDYFRYNHIYFFSCFHSGYFFLLKYQCYHLFVIDVRCVCVYACLLSIVWRFACCDWLILIDRINWRITYYYIHKLP